MTSAVGAMDRDTLIQAILDLENDRESQIPDVDVAHELAYHLKPDIDRLVGLRSRDPAMAAEIAANGDTELPPEGTAPDTEGNTERRKGDRGTRRERRSGAPDGPVPELLSLPPKDQARWIFMERFIPLEKHEKILGYELESERFAEYQQSFDNLLKELLQLPRMTEAAESNDIPALQRTFASTVLIFRNPCIGDDAGKPITCTLGSMRSQFPSYFYRKKKSSWFEKQDFYSEPLPGPRWVMADVEYLNCTLRKPASKLGNYAREWDLPSEFVGHKTVAEDIYDRIICGEALEEDLFANMCSSVTATTYRGRGKTTRKLVFTVQKTHKITIRGKPGVPHWRATRRLWPAVYPAVQFP
jgi:hypothetical protein